MNKNLFWIIALAALTIGLYLWAIQQPAFAEFILWSQQNIWIYFSVLVFIKILSGVWPPLPGGLLTLGSIPAIGWFPAYVADVVGAIIGSTIAYFLGKKYGWKFLEKLFKKEQIENFRKVKVVKKRELEAMVVLRLFYGVVGEIISYGSGLIGVSYKNFILGIVGWAVIQAPVFYISQNIFAGRNIALNAGILVIAVVLFYKFKGRYFE